jgi:hypothetical protein
VSSEASVETVEAPPRFLLRPAGVLTQLCSAGALLLGTIAFVLVSQNKSSGTPLAIAWSAAAMAGLVFGGVMARGGLVAVIAGAALDAMFGIVLLALDDGTLRGLLRILPASDVHMIGSILVVGAVVMLATAALALASIPQARAYGKALHVAEVAYAEDEAAMAQSFQAMRTQPPMASTPASYAPTNPRGVSFANVPSGPPPPGAAPFGLQPFPTRSAVMHAAPETTPWAPAYPSAAPPAMPAPMPAPPPPSEVTTPDAPGPRYSFPSGKLPLPPPAQTGPRAMYVSRPSAPIQPPPPAPGTNPWDGSPTGALAGADAWAGEPSPGATSQGWTPNRARTTMMLVRAPAAERRSRRRIYIGLAGLAIGVGIGVGAVVSAGGPTVSSSAPASGSADATSSSAGSGSAASMVVVDGAGSAGSGSAGSGSAGSAETPPPVVMPDVPVRALLTQQRDLIGKVDATGLAGLVATNAFAIGLDADDVAEGRAAIEEMLRKDLGEAPPDGFTVTSRFLAVGQQGTHAWTAEELEVSGPGVDTRRIAITQLCAFLGGRWTVLALHWGRPIPDATAERLAVLGTLPSPAPIPDRATGSADLAKAVRAAFASRAAFAAARSERPDAFNFGSAPGERIVGGAAIKRVFGRLRAELHLRDGVRVVDGGGWDPAQKAAPWIAYAALDVDYTQKSRAATDLTHTFRVLAILLREGDAWTIVQTQFSHAL